MEQESNLIKLTENIVLGFDGVSRFPKSGKASRLGEYTHPSIKIADDDSEYIINIEIFHALIVCMIKSFTFFICVCF